MRWLRWRSCSPWAPRWPPLRSKQRRVLWQWQVAGDRNVAEQMPPCLAFLAEQLASALHHSRMLPSLLPTSNQTLPYHQLCCRRRRS